MAGFARRGTELTCDGVSLSEIARAAGTPVYVYSRELIEENYRRFDAAFATVPHLVCYATKANSNLSVLRVLAELGAGADVVSGGELRAALEAGIPASRIVFSGVGKTEDEIAYAVHSRILTFNAESERELEKISAAAGVLGRTARVALRVNPDIDAKTHPYISTGLAHNKFGIGIAKARSVYDKARGLPGLSATGVQAHIGSQITDAAVLAETARELASLARELMGAGFPLETLDVGGGIGIATASGPGLSPEAYAEAVLPELAGLPLKILTEPGRAIVGPAGALVTRVLDVKGNGGKRFVVVDAGMNDLIRPALYEAEHPIEAVVPHNEPCVADVVGPVCESSDIFARDRTMDRPREGDFLAILDVGRLRLRHVFQLQLPAARGRGLSRARRVPDRAAARDLGGSDRSRASVKTRTLFLAGALLAGACREASKPAPKAASNSKVRPSILLVTLDTTRADAIGPEAKGVETPAFNALAARGRRFRQAYATVPETLPSHASLMTGLYPAGHGVHENARFLPSDRPVLAEKLRQAGFRTEAFVSAFTLARRFGLARGFDVYDDDLPAASSERPSSATTDRALASLAGEPKRPLFLWVHYYDPHAPYAPAEPFRSRYAKNPYLGEVAAMDEQLGRLVKGFEEKVAGPHAILIVSDHGEGLGDHGESQHGDLLYQSTIHVPLLLVGPGVESGVSDAPVSTRRVFHTILDWAGLDKADSLRGPSDAVVLAEAMKPYLSYGWQPQVMGVLGSHKAVFAGRLEAYDVVSDPSETRDIAAQVELPRSLRVAIREYPVASLDAPPPSNSLGEEELRKLASLGYISARAVPPVRKDAPRPADMVRLLDVLEEASGLFVRGEYAKAIPLLERILKQDPGNLDAQLRLATAHSNLGHEARALEAFEAAQRIAPDSQDVRTYLALHYARGKDWEKAVPLLERIVAEAPDRLPALEALAVIRERQGRVPDSIALRQKIYGMRKPTAPELVRLGQLCMGAGQTPQAIEAFEAARSLQGGAFAQDLELGVLYLAARRLPEARAALDRVPASSPAYPMALFKRAQVAVLLQEPDRAERIEMARRKADATTRRLIASERLFQGTAGP